MVVAMTRMIAVTLCGSFRNDPGAEHRDENSYDQGLAFHNLVFIGEQYRTETQGWRPGLIKNRKGALKVVLTAGVRRHRIAAGRRWRSRHDHDLRALFLLQVQGVFLRDGRPVRNIVLQVWLRNHGRRRRMRMAVRFAVAVLPGLGAEARAKQQSRQCASNDVAYVHDQ